MFSFYDKQNIFYIGKYISKQVKKRNVFASLWSKSIFHFIRIIYELEIKPINDSSKIKDGKF